MTEQNPNKCYISKYSSNSQYTFFLYSQRKSTLEVHNAIRTYKDNIIQIILPALQNQISAQSIDPAFLIYFGITQVTKTRKQAPTNFRSNKVISVKHVVEGCTVFNQTPLPIKMGSQTRLHP